MERYQILRKRVERLTEQRDALKSALLSESILDTLISAIFGQFIQTSADNFKKSSEYKKIISKLKKVEKDIEKTHDEAEDAYNEYMKKYAPKFVKKKTKIKFNSYPT